MSSPILEIKELTKSYGGLTANDRVSFSVYPNEIIGIIGPNGSGKTTLFDLITGFQAPNSGSILLNKQEIVGLPPHRLNHLGIARTFQKVKPFQTMTVLDNVITAALPRCKTIGEARERSNEYLSFVGMTHKKDSLSGTLSTGQRKRLEVARALATLPKVFLFDEPAGGVDPEGVRGLSELIKRLRETGMTIIVIEHKMSMIVDISDRLVAMDQGRKIADGPPAEVIRSSEVVRAYMGESYARGQ